MEGESVGVVWPHVIVDALEARGDGSRRHDQFTPLLLSRQPESGTVASDPETPLVENEPGLCAALTAVAARVQGHNFLSSARACAPNNQVIAPEIAAATRRQQTVDFPLRCVDLAGIDVLGSPLLFSSLLHNREETKILRALGERWRLPRRSAFFLGHARRWHELAPLIGRDGYRLLMLDPPWHSKSVQRSQSYATRDRRTILRDVLPAIRALASPTACLLCVWVTNSKRVQDFVEFTLFPQCGAKLIARWYWLKLAADGSWAAGTPTSSHKKPWEVCLMGYCGTAPPPPLPPRLVLVCVPYQRHHSAKPSLDPLLREHAASHLSRAGREDEMRVHSDGIDEQAATAQATEECWARLPKCEMFARDVKPYWHACGDEVLRYQHESFFHGGCGDESVASDVGPIA